MNEVNEAYANYLALKSEAEECCKIIKEAKTAESRLRVLNSSWQGIGLIKAAEIKLSEFMFPIYDKRGTGWSERIRRIVNVDSKWVSLKCDGETEIVRYRRETGKIERGRGDCQTIDVVKAIEIWESRVIYDPKEYPLHN